MSKRSGTAGRTIAKNEWITLRCIEWIKALHVIAVISWMAGMLYLPRLFVYHCEAEIGSKQSETFKIMEWRLLKAIINPAMIVTWLAGLYWPGVVIGSRPAGLMASCCWCWCCRVSMVFFPLGQGFHSRPEYQKPEIYRIINEVPTVDDRDRNPGDREAVLSRIFPSIRRFPPACEAPADFLYWKSHPTQADVVAFRLPH